MERLKYVRLLVLVAGSVCCLSATSKGSKDTNWYLVREKNDISLFYRWVETKAGDEIREMKAEFVVNATIKDILHQFSNSDNYKSWAAGIKSCSIEKSNDSLWYTYAKMNYPWPLRKKDLVTKHAVRLFDNSALLYVVAVPDRVPEEKGFERMRDYLGTWNLCKIEKEVTSVVYLVRSCEKPVFPRAIQDPIIQKVSIESLLSLKQLAEAK